MHLDTLLDSQYENTPRHPCDSYFPKGISALSWSFLLENWNKTNVYEMITHYTSCQQCRTVSTVSTVSTVIARFYLHLRWYFFVRTSLISLWNVITISTVSAIFINLAGRPVQCAGLKKHRGIRLHFSLSEQAFKIQRGTSYSMSGPCYSVSGNKGVFLALRQTITLLSDGTNEVH